jgi:hypothetical protein
MPLQRPLNAADIRSSKCLLLLISLLLIILLYPYFEKGNISSHLLSIFTSLSLLAGVYALSAHRRQFIAALILAIPTFGSHWVNRYLDHQVLNWFAVILPLIFYSYCTVMVIVYVLQSGEITVDRIYGAICGYLLIGWTGGILYNLVELIHPGSFDLHAPGVSGHSLHWSDLIYYSFCTLTTVGYGDISPITSQARSLSVLEAITGILYVAILISRLAGLYKQENRNR